MRFSHWELGTALLAVVVAFRPCSADAAALTWDVVSGDGGTITDGSGNWNDGAGNWNTGAGDATWNNSNPDNAVIGSGGAAGTISLTGPVTVGNITFNAVSSGSYTIQNGTQTLSGATVVVCNTNATIRSMLYGPGSLRKSGPGTLTLWTSIPDPNRYGPDNKFTGGLIVDAGELDLNHGTANEGSVAGVGSLTINSGAKVVDNARCGLGFASNWNGAVTHLTISNGTLQGTYSGNTICATNITLIGGTWSGIEFVVSRSYRNPQLITLPSTNMSVISTKLSGQGWDSMQPTSWAFNVAKGSVPSGVDLLLSGELGGGNIPLTKSGAGVMVLAATNTYSGSTTVNSGSLVVNGAIATTNPVTVTVMADATLGGSGSIDGVVTVESGGHLAPGDVNSHGTLTLTASTLNFNDGAELDCRIGGTTLNPTNGTVDLTGANSTVTFGAHATINLSRSAGSTVVPNGKVYVIFRYKSSTPPTLPEWTFNYIAERWRNGQVSLGTGIYTNSIVLTVSQAPKGTLLSVR